MFKEVRRRWVLNDMNSRLCHLAGFWQREKGLSVISLGVGSYPDVCFSDYKDLVPLYQCWDCGLHMVLAEGICQKCGSLNVGPIIPRLGTSEASPFLELS